MTIAAEVANPDFAARMQRSLGTPYLHYNSHKSVDLSGASLEQLWAAQKSLFTKRFNALNKQGAVGRNYAGVRKLLQNWGTEGQIGSQIVSALNDVALFDGKGQATAYGTSGGVAVGDFTVANARSAFNKSKTAARGSITPIIEAVNGSINSIIKVLADNQEYLLAQAIVEAYYTGARTVPADLPIPANTSVGSNLLAVSDNKLVATIKTLGESLDRLAALKGSTLKADAYRVTYSEIVGSIRSSLNSIGGTMHEVGVTFATLQAAIKGEQMLQKNNDVCKNIVASTPGGHFTANWVAQETSVDAGQETKDDVSFSWSEGNVTIQFGGSIKLRQGQAFKGSGSGSEALALNGFVSRQENLKAALNKLEQYAAGVTESATSIVAALNDESGAGEWYAIKQRVAMLSLVDAIAGSGMQGDFSAILVVNNRIFTMTDILDSIGQTLTQIDTVGATGKGFTVHGAELSDLQNKVSGQSQQYASVGKQALSRNRAAWQSLQDTKISISINLGYLFGSNVFQ